MSNQVMAPLDYEMAAIIHEHIFNKGVNLILEDGVKSFAKKKNGALITLQSGEQVQAYLIILAIGVNKKMTPVQFRNHLLLLHTFFKLSLTKC
ncbi:MAG: hypothetical protein APF81_03160 [Desulfosporosinus sp. BRH_c37]|nr:MAG: hypothetical protein APF81_03160 [Desulfosporosinus sp. BRH_c37]